MGARPAPSKWNVAEWRWALVVSLLALIVSSLPYAAGLLVSSSDVTFGGVVVNIEDTNTYLSKMQQGARGEWTYRFLFTSEPHRAIASPPFYVVLGHMARWTGLSLVTTFHLARVVAGLLMLLSVYAFVSLFLHRPDTRRVAFLLAAFSSGLGWLGLLIAPPKPGVVWPVDFWLVEAYLFFSLLAFPHFCLSVTALLGVFGGTLLYMNSEARGILPRVPQPALLGLVAFSALVLAITHPYMVLVVDVTLLGYCALLWRMGRCRPWRAVVPTGVAGLVPLPLLAYMFLATRADPVLRSFVSQNATPSPQPWYYLLGYGLVVPLALLGAWRAVRCGDERKLFLIVWIIAVSALVYAPLLLQRRMVEGLHIALCVLASHGLADWLPRIVNRSWLARLIERRLRYPRRRLRSFILSLILALSSISSVYLVAGLTSAAATRHQALFHVRARNEALEWLATHSEPDDTVLAGFTTGNYIPARIGHRVFLGHIYETAQYDTKARLVHAFYAGEMSDARALQLLSESGIVYLYYGPEERSLGGFEPATKPYLDLCFAIDQIAIYRVLRD